MNQQLNPSMWFVCYLVEAIWLVKFKFNLIYFNLNFTIDLISEALKWHLIIIKIIILIIKKHGNKIYYSERAKVLCCKFLHASMKTYPLFRFPYAKHVLFFFGMTVIRYLRKPKVWKAKNRKKKRKSKQTKTEKS